MPRNYDSPPAAHQRLPEYRREDEWIRRFLHRAQVAHIATAWEAQPFVTPSTFWYDQDGHRVVFHSNVAGRLRANLERNPRACLEASELGRLLPSNVALEFSLQYRSVMVFGQARVLEAAEEQRAALYGLVRKYFPGMHPGEQYRPITEAELRRTSVYALAIESWSGKENWAQRAEQSGEWPPLDEKWFDSI